MQTLLIPCNHAAAELERDFHTEIVLASFTGKLPEELDDLITIRVVVTDDTKRIYIDWK